MADVVTRTTRSFRVDKKTIQKIVAEQHKRLGIAPDPTATAEKAQEMMLAHGIRPEENLFSRLIIADRDEE